MSSCGSQRERNFLSHSLSRMATQQWEPFAFFYKKEKCSVTIIPSVLS